MSLIHFSQSFHKHGQTLQLPSGSSVQDAFSQTIGEQYLRNTAQLGCNFISSYGNYPEITGIPEVIVSLIYIFLGELSSDLTEFHLISGTLLPAAQGPLSQGKKLSPHQRKH